MSTGKPHPLADNSTTLCLPTLLGGNLFSYDVQIYNDLVSLLVFGYEQRELAIWEWKTGSMLLVRHMI